MVLCAIAVITANCVSGCDGKAQQAAEVAMMDDIYKKVINDSIDQYNIVKRQGGEIDRCVHAGLVAAAYLQAKKEAQYATWKQIERTDCESAGVPVQ